MTGPWVHCGPEGGTAREAAAVAWGEVNVHAGGAGSGAHMWLRSLVGGSNGGGRASLPEFTRGGGAMAHRAHVRIWGKEGSRRCA